MIDFGLTFSRKLKVALISEIQYQVTRRRHLKKINESGLRDPWPCKKSRRRDTFV